MDWWFAAFSAAFVTGLAVVAIGAGSATARLFLAASRHGSHPPHGPKPGEQPRDGGPGP